MDSTSLPSLQIAALLHDIGKFWQRTGQRHSPSYEVFGQETFGPHGAHAKWSADFVERFVPESWRGRPHDVLTHHKPSSYNAKIIAVADWLSSAEREAAGAGHEASVQLLSIFSKLGGRIPWQAVEAYYPLRSLSLRREAIFPQPGRLLAATETRPQYRDLWGEFVSDLERLPNADFEPYFVALYYLLQKHTWCIPSAGYRHVSDVSLFDHARTTCAIATCLFLEGVAEDELDGLLACPRRTTEWQAPRFTLISGDISGVQSFIYTITSKGAARGLRGRSFYLQMLGEAVADFVLRALDLPIANLLYAGGGRFFILAPLSARDKLAQIRLDTAHAMMRAHRGDLYLAIGDAPLSPQDFLQGGFGVKWREASQRADEEKRRKMADVAKDSYRDVFGEWGQGGVVATGNECDLCGTPIVERGKVISGVAVCPACQNKQLLPAGSVPLKVCDVCLEEIEEGEISGGTLKCDNCAAFEDLGRQIASAREDGLLVCFHHSPPGRDAASWQQKLWRVGKVWPSFTANPEPDSLCFTIGDTDFVRRGCQGFRFLASVTPHAGRDRRYRKGDGERMISKGEIKEFSLLAEDAAGIDRLGILRMDVDDLGLLFRDGLGEQATISRVSSLSFHLRTFFEGWLNVICDEVGRDTQGLLGQDLQKAAEERLYVIYAGGDDLFIVGSWDRLPILAEAIRENLRLFAAGNPNVHISAGIVLAEEHFPLYQAADASHEALDGKAKKFTRGDGRAKDAVCFLDTAVAWEDFAKVKGLAFTVQKLIGEGVADGQSRKTVPKALISSLGAIYRQYERDRQRHPQLARNGQDRVYYGRWMWLAAYNLHRLAGRLRSPGRALETEIENIRQELTNPLVIRNLGLVARWAEFLLRNGKEDKR